MLPQKKTEKSPYDLKILATIYSPCQIPISHFCPQYFMPQLLSFWNFLSLQSPAITPTSHHHMGKPPCPRSWTVYRVHHLLRLGAISSSGSHVTAGLSPTEYRAKDFIQQNLVLRKMENNWSVFSRIEFGPSKGYWNHSRTNQLILTTASVLKTRNKALFVQSAQQTSWWYSGAIHVFNSSWTAHSQENNTFTCIHGMSFNMKNTNLLSQQYMFTQQLMQNFSYITSMMWN